MEHLKPIPMLTKHFIQQLNSRARWLSNVNTLQQVWSEAKKVKPARVAGPTHVRNLARDSVFYMTRDYSNKRPPVIFVLADGKLVTVYPVDNESQWQYIN